MAKVKAPKMFLGNYVKFSLEKIIERHSARGEWKYIPYINDYKRLFVELPNGDIIDYETNKKIDVFKFEELENLEITSEVRGATNLVPLTKYYSDVNAFLNNIEFVLSLLNQRLDQSNGWIKKENLTLQANGLFTYSGELTEEQKIIMTMDDNINFAFNGNEISPTSESIDVDDNLYIGFLVEREMSAYYVDDFEIIGDPYLDKNIHCYMLPKVRLFNKTEKGYVDVKNNAFAREINISELKMLIDNGLKYLEVVPNYFYIKETVGVCNIIKLSDFLNNLGAFINPNEDIEVQINACYSDVEKFYMYDKVSPIKYPEIKSILKRSLTINKK